MNKKKFMKIFFPVLGTGILLTGIYWSVIEFVLKDYQNIGYIQFRYIVDQNGNSDKTPAYITGIKDELNYPAEFEVPTNLLGHPVVGIDAQAFKNLKRLTKVILPKTVEEIGDEAFSDCPLLTDVVVKGELKSVGNDIFRGSGWLNAHSDQEFITFGNFLYKYNGKSTTDFTVKSEKDKKDDENASEFIYIPSEITNFASGAFSDQPHLVGVEMPTDFTVIEKNMFQNCTNLTYVEINNVKTIQSDAFANCGKLNSIDLTKISSIGSSAFKGTALETVVLNNEITEINQSVFEDCLKLSSITIPNTVTSIGNYAFAGDIALNEISLSDNVVTIGNGAFSASGIKEFTFPKSIDTINDELFLNAHSLTKVVLPEADSENTGILAIGKAAFKNAECLEAITFPKDSDGVETIRTIGESAFENAGLKTITIPKQIGTLDKAVLKNCKLLEEVNFYEDGALTTINAECFSGTTSLNEITFPNTINKFFSAILMDSGVSKVNLPNNSSFTTINSSFFQNCVNLEEIIIPESVTTIDADVFKGCINLKNITLGKDIRSISSGVFEDNKAMTTFTVPNRANAINNNAFKNCTALESIYISINVKSIGVDAFLNDESLENVYYYGSIEDWNNIDFKNENANPMKYAKHFFIQDENNEWVEATELLDVLE